MMNAPKYFFPTGHPGRKATKKIRMVHPSLHDIRRLRADEAHELPKPPNAWLPRVHPQADNPNPKVLKQRAVLSLIHQRNHCMILLWAFSDQSIQYRLCATIIETRDYMKNLHLSYEYLIQVTNRMNRLAYPT